MSKFRQWRAACVCSNLILCGGRLRIPSRIAVAPLQGHEVGSGLEPGVAIGSDYQRGRRSARSDRMSPEPVPKAARLAAQDPHLAQGSAFTAPIVPTGRQPTTWCWRNEETFGPRRASLLPLRTTRKAIANRNASPLRSFPPISTPQTLSGFLAALRALEAGHGRPHKPGCVDEVSPFVGVKQSYPAWARGRRSVSRTIPRDENLPIADWAKRPTERIRRALSAPSQSISQAASSRKPSPRGSDPSQPRRNRPSD